MLATFKDAFGQVLLSLFTFVNFKMAFSHHISICLRVTFFSFLMTEVKILGQRQQGGGELNLTHQSPVKI